MPSASRRRSRSVFEDEESSGSESSKRQRLDYDNDDVDGEDSGGGQASATQRRPTRANGTSSATDGYSNNSEYQPGAILRVMMDNFVTYEHAEFFPGPNLNMIIGPNGTGKSSLVCAICLGLGYNPKHLGRATHVGEFVKHGKDTATIEIELQKRPQDRVNPVVRVQISREDNGRKWWLNTKETTNKAIQSLTRSMRIQIDNLCQFLPQDKVAEFAGLTPVQLLHETLRAAAPEKMINWQDQLKDLHQDRKRVKAMFDSISEALKGNETRQQGLQADVDRLQEREAIQKEVEDWQKVRICAEYQSARERHKEANKKRKEAGRRLKDLEEACGPALEAVNRKQDYQDKLQAVVDERQTTLKAAENAAEQGLKVVEDHDEKLRHLDDKKSAEIRSRKSRKEEIGKIRRVITNLESKQRQPPPPFNAADWNQKIRQEEHNLRDIEGEKRELSTQIEEVRSSGKAIVAEQRNLERQLDSLDSQAGQQLSFLKSINADAAKGWEWLQENRDGFEKEVFGPPMLTCSLKDDRYSDLIQSMLQFNDFVCFTAQTRNDHMKLSNQFYKEMGLSVTIRTCGTDFRSFQAPVRPDEAQQLGLDGFAIDYLEGPEPVLAMLCSEKYLHASGVALREITNDQYNMLFGGQKISQWATGQTSFRVIRRREYGPDATTTSTRKINRGRFWTDQPVDTEEKTSLQTQLDEVKRQRAELTDDYKEKQSELDGLAQKEEDIRERLDELKKEKSELQMEHTLFQALPEKIATEEDRLKEQQEDLAKCTERIINVAREKDEVLIAKAGDVLRHKDLVSQIREAQQALLDMRIRLIEAQSDVRGLKERNVEMMNHLEEEKQKIETYAAESDRSKREAVEARTKVERLAQVAGVEGLNTYNNMVGDKTLEDIDHIIDAKENALSLIHTVDPSVLRQFERRAKEIQDQSKKKGEMTKKLEGLDDQIKRLMAKFEPRLDQLIDEVNNNFSHNFEQISCAGEVGVHKDEDFEQWSIEIKVKFRENETLQQLDQHRQSGGERAVSTIFYLMALQSMAQAPFRVVDEINQGMDPRNERMVHERMVEIACREHTSQYLLITPKLLTGLRYDERMRVLCIASGEHVPDDGNKLDFGKLVQTQRAIHAAA